MSRDYRDQSGGHPNKFYINNRGHSSFAKQCSRRARRKATQDLQRGQEPQPTYPVEREYFD